jgi:TonB family protein
MRPLRSFTLLLLLCSSLCVRSQDGVAAKDSIYDLAAVKDQPDFPGGMQAMYKWLATNTNYPREALDKEIQGKVYVEFVVEKDGHVDHVVVRRGCNPLLDQEALRVIGQMPAWEPGRLEDGTVVPTRFTIPIDFKLTGKKHKG